MSSLAHANSHTFLSGFCNPSNDAASHERCPTGYNRMGYNGGDPEWVPCSCSCHHAPAAEVSPAQPSRGVSEPQRQVTEPALLPGMDEAVYHADPVPAEMGGSLSHSGAKKLVPPSTPAHFRHYVDTPQESKPAFSIGKAVHAKVLGIGADVVVIDGDRRTKEVKAAVAEAEAKGLVVLKAEEYAECDAMAEAVLAHSVAALLFERGYGTPEVSAFWRDEPSNVMLRCRYDWLPDARPNGRLVVPDLKTTINADPDAFGKSAANFGYFMQDPFYLDGLRAHGLGDDNNAFIFVLVEKTEPHLVSVVQLDQDARALGRRLIRNAVDLFAQCKERDEWPGYTSQIATASLPTWFTRLHEEYAA